MLKNGKRVILGFLLRLRVMMDQLGLKNSTRRTMGHALAIEGNARDLYALFISRLTCRYI